MKLISCHIDNFGTFHNFDMTFDESLNIIMHENGWGKSTLAAFIRAMLYGYDNTRKKDITENDRKRYRPWQGGKYGGTLTFEKGGKRYLVSRTFGETARFDQMTLRDLSAGKSVSNVEHVGEWLFKLDGDAFRRSAFINQNTLNAGGSGLSFHARLNALLGEASDVGAYDRALKELTARTKDYEKTGNRGYISEIQKKIDDLLVRQREARERIRRVEELRREMAELDGRLERINGEIDGLKKQLDQENAGKKEREAARKLYQELREQKREADRRLEELLKEAGGRIPTADEVQTVRTGRLELARVTEDLAVLQKQEEEKRAEILAGYDALLDQESELEKEYDALLAEGPVPKEEELHTVRQNREEMEQILETLGELVNQRRKEQEKIQAQYEALLDGQTALEKELEEASKGLDGYIPSSDEIQNIRRGLDERKRLSDELETLTETTGRLKRQMEELSARYRGSVPKAAEVSGILQNARALDDMESQAARPEEGEALKQAEETMGRLLPFFGREAPAESQLSRIQEELLRAAALEQSAEGLKAQEEGERAKLDGFESAIRQFDAAGEASEPAGEAPKPVGAACCLAGAILLAVLGAVVSPVLFAAAAVFAAVGAVLFAGNRKKGAELKLRKEAFAQERLRAREKRAALEAEREEALASLRAMEAKETGMRLEAEKIFEAALAYLSRWISAITRETAASECAALLSMLREWTEAERIFRAETGRAEARNRQVEGLKARLEAGTALLPADTQDQPLEQRVEQALADIEEFSQLKADVRIRVEQVSGQEGKLRKLDRTLQEFFAKCRIKPETAKERLLEIEEQSAAVLDAKQRLLSHQKRVTDFEEANRAVLTGKSSAPGERKLKERQRELTEKVQAILARYGTADHEIPQWLSVSQKRIAVKGELDQKRKTLEKQISDFEKANKAALTPQKGGTSPDTAMGRLEARRMSLTNRIQEILSRYEVRETEADGWLDGSERRIADLLDLRQTQSAAKKQLSDFEREHREQLREEDVKSSPLAQRLSDCERNRDLLIRGRTEAEAGIKHADETLESYRAIVQQLKALGAEKQSAQRSLYILKKSIEFLGMAKENLASRYLGQIETNFNQYLEAWIKDQSLRGMVDTDFHITMEQDGKERPAEGYSASYTDMIDFCMRMALIDTLFEEERPFIIMDDPFVNLDEEHLEHAMRLLKAMSADSQILYFVCHPIRAAEPGEGAAEIKRKRLVRAQPRKEKTVSAAKKETYQLVPAEAIAPVCEKKRITNNIFSLVFRQEGNTAARREFEVFFTDENERVLCDKQQVSAEGGEVLPEKLCFCLNTGKASGKTYTLMIRNMASPEHEMAKKIPFEAALTFASDFDF